MVKYLTDDEESEEESNIEASIRNLLVYGKSPDIRPAATNDTNVYEDDEETATDDDHEDKQDDVVVSTVHTIPIVTASVMLSIFIFGLVYTVTGAYTYLESTLRSIVDGYPIGA